MTDADWSLLYVLLVVLFTATGQLLFRMHFLRSRRTYLVAALGTFLTVPLFSYLALRNLSLAFVYMSSAFTHVLVPILSRVFLDERIGARKALSIALITLGVITFNL